MKMNKFISCLCIPFFFISCNDDNEVHMQKRKVGNFIIEAQFNNDSAIDGKAKFYNNDGVLYSIESYKNGVKEGYSNTYYIDGSIKDSMYFINGQLHDFAFSFNKNGSLALKKTFYYGLTIGHHYSYERGNLKEYFFSDFNKNTLLQVKYDSTGRCVDYNFTSEPILTEGESSNQIPSLGVFLYFPKPPYMNIEFRIGLINKTSQVRDEVRINDNRLFLDTILPIPEKGWNYYISTHIESKKDSIEKTYLQELRQ